jgi:hypothetical protein
VIDLERALTDLADHLDVPDTGNSEDELTRRLSALAIGGRRRSLARVLLAAAAVMVVVSVGAVAVAPARHAVAGWLGIGAVEVRRTTEPGVTTPSTSRTAPTTATTPPSIAPTDLAAARKAVQFEIATPRGVAPPIEVEIDHRVPGGLVALNYGHFTLIEIATDKTQPPPLVKLVGGSPVEPVTVHGHAGLWIPAVHRIGYLDRSGHVRSDTIRRSGPVMLWERDGVTYRVEGPHTLAEAQSIADSIGQPS